MSGIRSKITKVIQIIHIVVLSLSRREQKKNKNTKINAKTVWSDFEIFQKCLLEISANQQTWTIVKIVKLSKGQRLRLRGRIILRQECSIRNPDIYIYIYLYVYSPQRQNIKKERQTGTEKYNVQLQANTNND